MRSHDGKVYYTVGEVAERIGVSRQTLRVWERRGLVAPGRSPGGQRLYLPEDLEQANQVAMLRRRRGWNPAAISDTATFEPARRAWGHLGLGARVRTARRSRGFSVAQAAELIGISRPVLSSIERGESTVSSRLLSAIADGLSMPNTALVPHHDPGSQVVNAGDRPRTVLADGVTWEELVAPGHALAPAILIVPGGASSGGMYTRPGETFMHLLSGSLVVGIDDGPGLELTVGDSLLLLPSQSWGWSNPAEDESRVLYVEQIPADAWR